MSRTLISQLRYVNLADWAWAAVLIGLAAAAYLPFSLVMQNFRSDILNLLVLLLWIDIAIYSLLGWYKGLQEKPQLNLLSLGLAVGAGLLYILGTLLSGWLWGFGKSPYQLSSNLGQILIIASGLIGLESARAYLLVLSNQRAKIQVFIIIILFFALLGFPLSVYRQIFNGTISLSTFGESILPALSHSTLLTFLAWTGGPWMAITYGIFPLAVNWLSPILPDLSWIQSAFTHTLLPIGIILLINFFLHWEEESHQIQSNVKNEISYSWLLVVAIGVGLVWFNTGLFGVRTYLTNGESMEPSLQTGDLVLIQKCTPDEIEVGDIILYRDSTKYILHRVVKINDQGEYLEFITQGDANNLPDQPASSSVIEGKAIYKIPKIGWISIYLKKVIGWINYL